MPDAQVDGGGQNIGWSESATQSAAGKLLDGALGIDTVDLSDNTYCAGYKAAAGVGAGAAFYYSPSSSIPIAGIDPGRGFQWPGKNCQCCQQARIQRSFINSDQGTWHGDCCTMRRNIAWP